MGKKISNFFRGELVSSIFYILLGICLILFPVQTVNVICKVVFGLVLIGSGVYHIIVYVRKRENATVFDMFTGVIVLILGLFLFSNPQIVVKLLPLMLGAVILVDCIWVFQTALMLKKKNAPRWKIFMIAGFIDIAAGILLMWNPFQKVRQTVLTAGILFALNGISDIVLYVFRKKELKEEKPEDTEEEKTVSRDEYEEYEEPDYVMHQNDAHKGKEDAASEKPKRKWPWGKRPQITGPEADPAETAAEDPEIQTAAPDVVVEEPDIAAEEPEISPEGPDIAAEEPEISTEEPDIAAEEPDFSEEETDTAEEEPDLSAEDAEAQADIVDAAAEEPGSRTDIPDLVVEHEEETGSSYKPELTLEPDLSGYEPDPVPQNEDYPVPDETIDPDEAADTEGTKD